jgi:nucleoid-associated protein YgaU
MATTIDPLLFSGSVSVRSASRPRPTAATFQRRRRVVGAGLAVAAFALASGLISTGAFASNPAPSQQVIPRTVIAQPGDTLWDIARTIVPTGNIGDLVIELVRANGSTIEPGQVIRIP